MTPELLKGSELAQPLASLIRDFQDGNETAFDIAKEALPDGTPRTVLNITRRRVNPEPPKPPRRAESPRRMHTFHEVDGFAAYLAKYKSADTVVLADIATQTISAILDEKAADGFEVVTLKPQLHPLFEPWADLLALKADDRLTVGEFAEFVMTNRRAIAQPDAKSLAMLMSHVKASKKITVDRGRGNKSLNGVMIETNIQGKIAEEPVDLPDSIQIIVPLFVGTEDLTITLDLLLMHQGDVGIIVTVTSGDVEERKVAAFENMLGSLDKIDGLVVAMGKPGYDEWRYLASNSR